MKKRISKLITKLIIRHLSNVGNESTLRVLNHAILLEMQQLETEEIVMTYEAELEGSVYKVITTSTLQVRKEYQSCPT